MNGEKHQIENGVNNSIVLNGNYGQATNQGEVIIAGGGFKYCFRTCTDIFCATIR